MKKKVLLSSISTIALCLCLIAGSTFALFTDTTSFNIAVTSGDVEIEAFATINTLYSAEGADSADTEYLVDEFGHTYEHVKRTDGKFYNKGTVELDGANGLVINNITPGDKVDVDINITNKSNVAFVYRYKIVAEKTNLATGMVVTVNANESYEGLASWTSEWYPMIALNDNGEGADVPVKTVSIELPVYAGNEYQSERTENKIESVSYTFTVEAVQANAVTDNEAEVILYNNTAINADGAGMSYTNEDIFEDITLNDAFVVEDVYLVGDSAVSLDRTFDTVILENVIADVDGDLIVVNTDNTIVLYDCDITLDDGEMLVSVAGNFYPQVMLHNVTVNGVLLTNATAGQYLENVGYYEVW